MWVVSKIIGDGLSPETAYRSGIGMAAIIAAKNANVFV